MEEKEEIQEEEMEGQAKEEPEQSEEKEEAQESESNKGKESSEKEEEEKKEDEPEDESAEEEEEDDKEPEKKDEKKKEEPEDDLKTKIFALRTTANREDQVMDFLISNTKKKKLGVHSVIRPHGMRGYIFVEADTKTDAEQAAFNVPYARGILPSQVKYKEIEHLLEQVKVEMNIQKSDIVEIISGPFKREKAKVTRIDRTKEEVVVELLESAVPIPITVKMDAVKVIRREGEEEKTED